MLLNCNLEGRKWGTESSSKWLSMVTDKHTNLFPPGNGQTGIVDSTSEVD